MISPTFFAVEPGVEVLVGSRKYRVTHQLSVDSVLAIDLESQQSTRLRIETVTRVLPETEEGNVPQFPVQHYSDEDWAIAQSRFQHIKPLLNQQHNTRRGAEQAAASAGVHVGTLYKWLAMYLDAGHVAALVPQKRGRNKGTKLLKEEQELVIASVIDDIFLKKQRGSAQEVVQEVKNRCKLARIEYPHANTIRRRIAALNAATVLRRRGMKDKARDKYEPIRGSFPGADYPLAVVQIDHTPSDVIVVDEEHRLPIGRPWITVAIDVFSRMVVGFYMTLDKPSATSVALCVSQGMCPKAQYLVDLAVPGDWPVWGQIGTLHADNAKEFKCKAVNRGCQAHHIDLQWRPVKKPHYGAHIERYMGVLATELKKVPGTTFSNIQQRKGYNSEKEASLTLKELEQYLVDFIVNTYHQRSHSELNNASPQRVWERAIMGTGDTPGIGLPPIPHDAERLKLDFLPYFEKTIQRYGVRVENVFYYDPVLNPYINSTDEDSKTKRKFIFVRDPRDIADVYFLDPAVDMYMKIPYRNLANPSISAAELRETSKRLKQEGAAEVDEHRIFESAMRNRELVANAVTKTKSARRQVATQPKPRWSERLPAKELVPLASYAPPTGEGVFDEAPELLEVGGL
ncbi:Mu transposase C-terminal domain-containing protein [Xanthomonas vasicola]|uniref:Mu transposase C-terminal domain-containing protein n=1 Tax=Xanthomonas vasicola TaxID=56459 RepID=UPI000531215F|nr:Mu transposase C-terminal domain-containing protein [Xanthomonas vasicola]AZR35205.1 urease subunit beta [Xanthomonas vasicola]AZR36464.1 urease subunit beta [Xanthomonas vasicola]KGR53806.1 urease subunit beta [Xanthomonas vasicola]KGR57692.1 urease subunit beta [Xanthomonas vasicola]KGT85925.1 urease subunit beta [Xanthomonas vasicola]